MNKKILLLCITILLLFSTVFSVNAISSPTIKVSSVEALPGETITVDVSMVNNPGINTFTLGFDYDTSRLTLKKVDISEKLGGQFIYAKKAVWFNNKDVTYSGKILTLTFNVSESAKIGDATVKVIYNEGDISNYDENDVNFLVVDGTVSIKSKVCNHTYKTTTTKATLSKNGKVETKCEICGDVSKSITIYSPSAIKLSTATCTYNGKTRSPSVTVKDSKGKTLVNGTDYTVTAPSGRKNPGVYNYVVTFKGNYTGTKTLAFTIQPKTVDLSSISATQSTSVIKLTWGKVTGATGYRVYIYSPTKKEYVLKASIKDITYRATGRKAGTAYKFKIKPYTKLSDGTVIWGDASEAYTTATECVAPSITSVTSPSKSKATVKWSNVSGESGYQLYYSTSKTTGYKKVNSYTANTTAASKTFTSSASGKTIYFKVRAYTKVNGQTIFSEWSAVKSVKIK